MSQLVVVNQAEEAWLDLITDIDMTLRLFRTDVTTGLTKAQIEALTQAAFTEANFAGYAAVSMTTAWTTTQGDPSEGSVRPSLSRGRAPGRYRTSLGTTSRATATGPSNGSSSGTHRSRSS